MTTLRTRIRALEFLPARSLQTHDHNWRHHPQFQQDALAGVLREVGIAGALLVYDSVRQGGRVILDGHLRQATAPDEVWPCLVLDVDDAEADYLLATYDPLTALAEAGHDELTRLLHRVSSGEASVQALLADLAVKEGLPLGGLGSAGEAGGLADVEPELDRAEELRAKWDVEVGQLWTCGTHRVICGDCTDKTVVERLMDGAQGQIIFTDPPYGVDYDGGMKKRQRLANDMVGTAIYTNALPVLASAVDEQAPLYLWYADAHAAAAAAAAAAAGFVIVAQIIWAKNHAQFMSSAHYHGKHEPCFYGHRRGKSARWYGPPNEVTLWECDRAPSNDYHPTQKPVPLAQRAITNSTIAGHCVLDGFLGGGTTLIACEQLGRHCYACEIDPGYVAVTLERWSQLTHQTPERIL